MTINNPFPSSEFADPVSTSPLLELITGFGTSFPFFYSGEVNDDYLAGSWEYPYFCKETVEEECLGLMMRVFRDKPRSEGYMKVIAKQIQDFETAICEVNDMSQFTVAFGVWLDQIGDVVDQARNGLDDDGYRVFILARQIINFSQGRNDDLTAILYQILGNNFQHTYSHPYPATTLLELGEQQFVTDYELIFSMLREAKSVGVRLLYVWPTAPLADSFVFASSWDTESSSITQGFASTYDSETTGTGGKLAGDLAS